VAILLVATTSLVLAGAWGPGSFDNDDALDWLSELTSSHDSTFVHSTLNSAKAQTYLEAPGGSSAIAAAEVVAAMLGRPASTTPRELTAWLKQHSKRPTAAQVAVAKCVVERVLDAKTSELAELWAEGDGTKWRNALHELIRRLELTE
jgi:hypothetical protein